MNRSRELVNSIFSVNRNYTSEELREKKVDLFDRDVCQNYLVLGYCPHYVLTGFYKNRFSCSKIHDKTFHTEFTKLPDHKKNLARSQVSSNLNSLVRFMDNKIKYSIENLNSSRRRTRELEQQSIIKKAKQKINTLYNKIKVSEFGNLKLLLTQIRELNELSSFVYGGKQPFKESRVTEYNKTTNGQILTQIEKIKHILENDLDFDNAKKRNKEDSDLLSIPQASICAICGAYILDNDTEQRALSHLLGKIHTSFYTIRKSKKELDKCVVNLRPERNCKYENKNSYRERRY